MDEEELKRESKLGLKKQQVVAPRKQEIPVDDQGRYDYLHMSPQIMATCLPMNTEVIKNANYIE